MASDQRGDRLSVVLTFDADPDRFDPSQPGGQGPTWHGIEEGIPAVLDVVEECAEERGIGDLPITWFLRSDLEVERHLGSTGALLSRYGSTWRHLREGGHEFGYHPHLTGPSNDATAEEPPDIAWQLEHGLDVMRSHGFRPSVSRLGEAHGSNIALRTLDTLGMKADSTAMPGRFREDTSRSFDWRGSPSLPYHPSRSDYRRPGSDGLTLLEIPMTMIPTQAPYDTEPIDRYIDLTFHSDLLETGLKNIVARSPLIVTVGHPSTLLPSLAPNGHGLLSYSSAAFKRNLNRLFEVADELDRPLDFRTMSGCVEAIEEGVIPLG